MILVYGIYRNTQNVSDVDEMSCETDTLIEHKKKRNRVRHKKPTPEVRFLL